MGTVAVHSWPFACVNLMMPVGQNSKMCVSTACPKGVTLCLAACDSAVTSQWDISAAGASVTVSPRSSNGAMCLQVGSKTLDASVFVGPCSSPVSDQQLWSLFSAPQPINGAYAGICARTPLSGAGVCLVVLPDGSYRLSCSGTAVNEGRLGDGGGATAGYTHLELTTSGSDVTASINGTALPSTQCAASSGFAAVVSGYNVAFFDNFEIEAQAAAM